MADFYILHNILEILIAVIYLKIITGLSYKLESLYQFISRQKYRRPTLKVQYTCNYS